MTNGFFSSDFMRLVQKAKDIENTKKYADLSLDKKKNMPSSMDSDLMKRLYGKEYKIGTVQENTSFDGVLRGVDTGPNAMAQRDIEKEDPGIISRSWKGAGDLYTKITRPYSALAYWGAVEARKAITGNDQGVDEMREYIKARRERTRVDSPLGNIGFAHFLAQPLNQEEKDRLDYIYKRNTLPWGVLGSLEVFIDPFNFIPATWMAKAVGKMGIKAFKASTRTVFPRKFGVVERDEIAGLNEPGTYGITQSDRIDEILGPEYGPQSDVYIEDYYKSFNVHPISSDIPYVNQAEFAARRRNYVDGVPPNINDSTTISATVDSVVKASDRQQSIRLSRDATFTRTGNAARIHAQELMGKEKFAWDIDAIGDVRNVSFNRIKAYDTRREIQKKLAATGADTVLGDERKHLERAQSYIDQMV